MIQYLIKYHITLKLNSLLWVSSVILVCNCVDEDSREPVVISWTFANGDCTSNGIEKVSVQAIPTNGATLTAEALCLTNQVDLGTAGDGSYSILAQGLDTGGVVRFENFGTTTSRLEGPFQVTLHPKSSNVIVTWNGCPGSVVLPYTITLYNKPPAGMTPTDKVKSVQESCSTRSATITSVQAGEYVVELDSRAVTPKVYSTVSVTVIAGEDAQVNLNVP